MRKILNIVLGTFLLSTFYSTSTFAAGNISSCQPVYGGGQSCPTGISFSINKQVQKPNTEGDFVDNLSVNDSKFSPSQNITFRINITNNSSNTIKRILVNDSLPDFTTFVSGKGNLNNTKRALTFDVNNLEPQKTAVFTIVVKTADSGSLPKDKGIVCPVNKVTAAADSALASDSSQFCIEKQVLSAVSKPEVFESTKGAVTPATGPDAIGLLALIPTGLFGMALRKRSL